MPNNGRIPWIGPNTLNKLVVARISCSCREEILVMCIALNRTYLCRGRIVCAAFCLGQLAYMHDIDRARVYRDCRDFGLAFRRAKKVKALEVATDGKMLRMQFQPTCGGVRVFQFNGSINNSNSRINSPTKRQCICVATRGSRDTHPAQPSKKCPNWREKSVHECMARSCNFFCPCGRIWKYGVSTLRIHLEFPHEFIRF